MTYEYFKQYWQEECLKEGVLTIPDGVEELDNGCGIAGNQEIKKVILPENAKLCIGPRVFKDCVNIESLENFPPVYKWIDGFIDEDTGETVSIERVEEQTNFIRYE